MTESVAGFQPKAEGGGFRASRDTAHAGLALVTSHCGFSVHYDVCWASSGALVTFHSFRFDKTVLGIAADF